MPLLLWMNFVIEKQKMKDVAVTDNTL